MPAGEGCGGATARVEDVTPGGLSALRADGTLLDRSGHTAVSALEAAKHVATPWNPEST